VVYVTKSKVQVQHLLSISKERNCGTVTLSSISPSSVESDLADHRNIRRDIRQLKKNRSTAVCGCSPRSEISVYLQWPFFFSRQRTVKHESHCPRAAWEVAVSDINFRLSFCSLTLKRKLQLSMALSSLNGSELQIKPNLKIRRVVSVSSPAFQLLNGYRFWGLEGLEADDRIPFIERIGDELLRLFQERRATPYDRLEDGSTLLHVSYRATNSCKPLNEHCVVLFGTL